MATAPQHQRVPSASSFRLRALTGIVVLSELAIIVLFGMYADHLPLERVRHSPAARFLPVVILGVAAGAAFSVIHLRRHIRQLRGMSDEGARQSLRRFVDIEFVTAVSSIPVAGTMLTFCGCHPMTAVGAALVSLVAEAAWFLAAR
ncbi:MAG: hypothetical protein KAX80_01460 [Planctomycetes bacterium]|nr:hypothetical protein [Planctomycetota bacterium]